MPANILLFLAVSLSAELSSISETQLESTGQQEMVGKKRLHSSLCQAIILSTLTLHFAVTLRGKWARANSLLIFDSTTAHQVVQVQVSSNIIVVQ